MTTKKKKTAKKVTKKAVKKPKNVQKTTKKAPKMDYNSLPVDVAEQNKLQVLADSIEPEIPLPMASYCRVMIDKRVNQNPKIRVGVIWALPEQKRVVGTDHIKINEPLEHVKGYSEYQFSSVDKTNIDKVVRSALTSAILSYNGESTPTDFYVE